MVVHLAFLITGTASRETTRAINVDGTAQRLPGGGGRRRPPVRLRLVGRGVRLPPRQPGADDRGLAGPAGAAVLRAGEGRAGAPAAAARRGGTPDSRSTCCARRSWWARTRVGAKDLLPGPLAPLGRRLAARLGRVPVPFPVAVPALPLQLVHEEDVGSALLLCAVGAGPPGAYNIAGDGVITMADVAREFGLLAVPVPPGPARLAARAVAALPFLPPAAQWVRGGEPAVHHGHRQGEAGAGLGAAIQLAGGAAGHHRPRPGVTRQAPEQHGAALNATFLLSRRSRRRRGRAPRRAGTPRSRRAAGRRP